MKRFNYPFAVATIALTVFSSCEESSDNIGSNPDFPTVSTTSRVLSMCLIMGAITFLNTYSRPSTKEASEPRLSAGWLMGRRFTSVPGNPRP